MTSENTLVINRANFGSREEFEKMVGEAVVMLLKNRNIMTIVTEETDIVRIDFAHDNISFGGDYPYWLTDEEAENLWRDRHGT